MKKLSLTIFLTFLSCLGENSWEDLESNYDHVLNVFGLISLDTSQRSYVGLYSTTDLGDTSQIYLGTDTIGWCNCDEEECSWSEQCDTEEIEGYWIIDSLFEPAALVKNASVTITDDNGNAYKFSFIESVIALDAGYSVSSINDVNNLNMSLDLNGKRMQTGNTNKMIFNVYHIVAYLSKYMSLQAGDIITTGTPPGVDMGKKPQVFLKNGDTMRLSIDNLGEQNSKVI